MRNFLPIALCVLLFAACKPDVPTPPTPDPDPDPQGTVVKFTESDENFPNPERGLHIQVYYESSDLSTVTSAYVINSNRSSLYPLTLYLHSYYLTDYMESDIPQEFLNRLDSNMNALRNGGGKVILRFSYKHDESNESRPWDASPEWISRHIDQIAPYLQKHSDIILCIQCGFIGVWGEWYYTSNFKMNPSKDEDYEPRWEVLEHLLQVLPEDRQVALRIPGYKRRYLTMRGLVSAPLTAEEAFKTTAKARICGHNDCFVSSSNDVGTYFSQEDRDFWAEDTKYTLMGGETCKCREAYSNGPRAISEMERYHWTYINRDYNIQVANAWRLDGSWDTILRRLGYRLVLDKAVITTVNPKVGGEMNVFFRLRNVGFAAPMNKRGLELILVSANDPNVKHVFPQTEVDPRFWLPGEYKFTLSGQLDGVEPGAYKLYLNLPDPYASLHDDPRYSIRLANKNIWDETTGYNYITDITVAE